MLLTIIPKLPMRDKAVSKQFYIQGLGFSEMVQFTFGEENFLYNS
jgi:hypothetical protein